MNNKEYYNDNEKPFKKWLISFFKESGFYVVIVLGLCVIAAGTVYFTTNNLISSPERSTPEGIISDNTEIGSGIREDKAAKMPVDTSQDVEEEKEEYEDNILNTGNSQDVPNSGTPVPTPTINPKAKESAVFENKVFHTLTPKPRPNTNVKNIKDAKEVINIFKKPQFIMPIQGEIINKYAMDKLIYSKTLDEWRTHSGIDIASHRGEVVRASADGVVSEIKNDPRYGITIIIDHQNGYKTVYANLACNDMVSPNQKVKAGDPISSIGNTAIFECADPPHLHFEIYKNNKLVDPEKYLAIKKQGA